MQHYAYGYVISQDFCLCSFPLRTGLVSIVIRIHHNQTKLMTTRNSRRTYPVKNILPMPKKAVCLCGFCNSCGAAKSAKSLKSRKIQKKKVKKPMIVVMTQKPLVGTRRHARLNAWERKPGPDEIKNKFSIHRTAAEHESSADDL